MAKLKRKKGLKDVTGDGKFTYADVLKMRGVKPKKSMGKGGTVEYGLGGAIMAGINAIKNKEGLVGGIKNVAKAYATPGSGIAQGAKLAGGMLANAKNPLLAGIGKAAGMASNFMPGGGGARGALGNLAQAGNLAGRLPGGLAGLAGQFGQNAGGSGMAGVMPALQGLFSQKHGGMVPVKLKYASEGIAVPEGQGEDEDPPVADFLLNRKPEPSNVADYVNDLNELQGARSDRSSAFGTSSTDVYMPVGNLPMIEPFREKEPDPVEEPREPRLEPIEKRYPYLEQNFDQDIIPPRGGGQIEEPEEEFDMQFVFDQTPLPKGEKDVRYNRYQKTMGVKDPKTGVYYYVDSARGFSGPRGKKSLSISSLPKAQRARALKAIEEQEMRFAGESDFYRRQRGM